MLSGPSTSETHTGHREPCETYRRLQAESGGSLTRCLKEVKEKLSSSSGPRKCDTCRSATREQAKIRRTAKHKAKMTARKQEIKKERRCQEFRTILPATSIEETEAADDVNTLPAVQAQEPMTHQVNTLPLMQTQNPMMHQHHDTIVKSEPLPPPPYSERQIDEDVAWNSIPDTIAWESSLRHEAAQGPPPQADKTEQEHEQGVYI